jgi:hypothetical protein
MKLDLERVRMNVQGASTEDLLERCTVFKDGMEPEALEIIEEELQRRGVNQDAIDLHARERADVLQRRGLPLRCSFCHRGAVSEAWGWHRLWGLLPLLPRRFRYCRVHEPRNEPEA